MFPKMIVSQILFYFIIFLIYHRSEVKNSHLEENFNDDFNFDTENNLFKLIINLMKSIAIFFSKYCDRIIVIILVYYFSIFLIDYSLNGYRYSFIQILFRLTFTPSLNFHSTGQTFGEYYCYMYKWSLFDFPNRDYFFIKNFIPECDKQIFYSIISKCK